MSDSMRDSNSATTVADEIGRLKKQIQTTTDVFVDEFYRKTGLSPSQIQIGMLEVTYAGAPVRVYRVGAVEMKFDL